LQILHVTLKPFKTVLTKRHRVVEFVDYEGKTIQVVTNLYLVLHVSYIQEFFQWSGKLLFDNFIVGVLRHLKIWI